MAKIKNTDFFKKGIKPEESIPENESPISENRSGDGDSETSNQEEVAASQSSQTLSQGGQTQTPNEVVPRKIQLSSQLLESVKQASIGLNGIGFPALAKDMANLYQLAVNKRFTVTFVGEFSRGKSTLINHILGADILPIGDLPTTALLTRIVYGTKKRIVVCGKDGKILKELPLVPESWKGLTAANFGEEEPEGNIIIEYPSRWLGQYAIDFLDTPGAGDLEEKRARITERALVNADGAIITIDATKALSMTEQMFIQQKIMSRGVPFVALALTKLDLIGEADRVHVISFLTKKLKNLRLSLPIIVANDQIAIPGLESLEDVNIHVGIESLKRLIVAWMANENRRLLMEKWLNINALTIVNAARAFLLQQKEILDAKDVEKERLIRQRNVALSNMHTNWEALRTEMDSRCQNCISAFMRAANEAGEMMIENLQHEVGRVPNPKEWLEKEYAYRVKRELSAISLSLDNLVSKRVVTDMHWLNNELNKQFKEIIGSEVSALMSREDFLPNVDDQAVKLESLKNKSVKTTLVSTALTLGAALMIGVTGGAPLILATMGVGTSAGLISKKMLEKEGERQRQTVQELIAKQIPKVIEEASSDSATKIKIIYNDIISESHNVETRWMSSQRTLIRNSVQGQGQEAKEQLANKLNLVEQYINTFSI